MATMRLMSLSGVWLLAATMMACGSSSDEPAGDSNLIKPGGPLSSDTFIEHLSAASCNSVAPCCAKDGIQYNGMSCMMAMGLVYGLQFGLAKTSGTFDPVAAQRCIDLTAANVSLCHATDDAIHKADEACSRVYAGQKALGEGCSATSQCKPEGEGLLTCDYQASGADGDGARCLMVRYEGKTGDACISRGDNYVFYHCNAELWCDEHGTGQCQARIALGQDCDTNESCVSGAACMTGRCQPPLREGEYCHGEGAMCAAGLKCSAEEVCVPKKALGESCGSNDECASDACLIVCKESDAMADPVVCGSGS